MFKEEFLQQLGMALYEQGPLNVYDYAAGLFTVNSEEFQHTKSWADRLVKDKLAAYTDTGHSTLELTNFGRFWMIKGGYESFLRESGSLKDLYKYKKNHIDALKKEKEELVEARLKLTHYRLMGFWLALIISIIGFLLSLYNLYLILNGKK